jgi:replicative DNA helicase
MNHQKLSTSKLNPNQAADLSSYVFGKVQPQAIPLEQVVLGALMLDRMAMPKVVALLKPESFYLQSHQHIYQAALNLFGLSRPIDLLTVAEELRRMGKIDQLEAGAAYLVEISNMVASAENIEYHSRIIFQQHIKRQLISISSQTTKAAYEDTTDAIDLLDQLTKFCISFYSQESKSSVSVSDAAQQVLEQVAKVMLSGKPLGMTTGFRDDDAKTGGNMPGELSIVAARPGMGKTQLVLQAAMVNARQGKHVHFISLEMTAQQLTTRVLAELSNVPQSAIRSGTITQAQFVRMKEAAETLRGLPFHIAYCSTEQELWAYASAAKGRGELDYLILDYLQLMKSTTKTGTREQEVSGISRTLKRISTELMVAVTALAQLSRAVELRPSKRPQLSDLRESGALEQDADKVTFIFRPEYYGFLEDEFGNSLIGVAEIDIAKQRSGAPTDYRLRFENGVFYDEAQTYTPPNTPHNPNAFIEPLDYQDPIVAARPKSDEVVPF